MQRDIKSQNEYLSLKDTYNKLVKTNEALNSENDDLKQAYSDLIGKKNEGLTAMNSALNIQYSNFAINQRKLNRRINNRSLKDENERLKDEHVGKGECVRKGKCVGKGEHERLTEDYNKLGKINKGSLVI